MMIKITLKNVKSFIRGHYNLYLDKLGMYPRHKQEQILYRISLCSDCVSNEGCKYCGCAPNKKVYDNKSCNDGERFPDMLNEVEWNKFKIDNKITVDEK
jgi:hypothetical protein